MAVNRKNKQSVQQSAERPVLYKTGCVYLQMLILWLLRTMPASLTQTDSVVAM